MFYGRGAGGAPDGQRRARRPRRRRPQPAGRRRGAGESAYADLRGAADGRDADPLPRGLDVADRAGVLAAVATRLRRARRVDPDRAPGGPRRRRPAGRRHPPAPPTPRSPRPSRTCAARHRPRGHLGDAGRGRVGMTGLTGSDPPVAGRDRGVPRPARHPRRHSRRSPSREGGTPLVQSEWLSELTGAEVWLKVEGDNPTGSFKDRGMTTAISVAAARRRQGRRLRLDRQHLARRRRPTPRGPASSRSCSCPRARSPPASWRRRSCTARR